MTPRELKVELTAIVANQIMDPVLIIGEAGVGKSSIVQQVGDEFGMPITDVRWGQLGPADARGVPVPDHEGRETVFYPPRFWPRKGPGIIFLDEFNMATAAMMGLGQQLLLDRKFGDYTVPDGVFIWAAGNRKSDMAAVNTIPGPVQNRLAHYEVSHDLFAYKIWAYENEIDPRIIGFLDWRSELLYKPHKDVMAWPSARSWTMADRRLKAGMGIAPVIGEATADEFDSYNALVNHLPNLDLIEEGRGDGIPFPKDVSMRFAIVAELTRRSLKSYDAFSNSVHWAISKCEKSPEWVATLTQDVVKLMRVTNPKQCGEYTKKILADQVIKRFTQKQSSMGGL